jgi:S2P endopeptidase
MSLDGVHIHNAEEWMEMTALIDNVTRQITDHTEYVEGFGTVNGRKGYCVPDFMIEDGQK